MRLLMVYSGAGKKVGRLATTARCVVIILEILKPSVMALFQHPLRLASPLRRPCRSGKIGRTGPAREPAGGSTATGSQPPQLDAVDAVAGRGVQRVANRRKVR